MTGTEKAEQEVRLLRAIAADPEDDKPRLEYARLLRDRGDPLGDFIHVDCAIASRAPTPLNIADLIASENAPMPTSGPWKVSSELSEWRLELLELHENEWSAPLVQAGAKDVLYRRGFPYKLTVEADTFPAVADRLFPLAPMVRALTLDRSNLDEDYNEIAPASPCPQNVAVAISNSPGLALLWQLALFGPDCWGDDAINIILDSPYLGELRHLDLTSSSPGPDVIGAALGSARFPQLQVLTLAGNPLGAEHMRCIADLEKVPPRLRVVDLSDTSIDDDAAEWVARAAVLTNLKELRLGGTRIGEPAIGSLVGSPYLQDTLIFFKPSVKSPDRHRIEEQLRRHNDQCLTQLPPK